MTNFATKADIRADFEAKPEKYSALSERQRNSIVSRGQAAEAAIKVFNRNRKGHRRYVRGQGQTVKAATAAARADLVSRGLAGKRGPLSQYALANLKG